MSIDYLTVSGPPKHFYDTAPGTSSVIIRNGYSLESARPKSTLDISKQSSPRQHNLSRSRRKTTSTVKAWGIDPKFVVARPPDTEERPVRERIYSPHVPPLEVVFGGPEIAANRMPQLPEGVFSGGTAPEARNVASQKECRLTSTPPKSTLMEVFKQFLNQKRNVKLTCVPRLLLETDIQSVVALTGTIKASATDFYRPTANIRNALFKGLTKKLAASPKGSKHAEKDTKKTHRPEQCIINKFDEHYNNIFRENCVAIHCDPDLNSSPNIVFFAANDEAQHEAMFRLKQGSISAQDQGYLQTVCDEVRLNLGKHLEIKDMDLERYNVAIQQRLDRQRLPGTVPVQIESFRAAFERVRGDVLRKRIPMFLAGLEVRKLDDADVLFPIGAFTVLDSFCSAYREKFSPPEDMETNPVPEDEALGEAHDQAVSCAIDAAIKAYDEATGAECPKGVVAELRTMGAHLDLGLRTQMQNLTRPPVRLPQKADVPASPEDQ